jgi:uncharacterized protein YyaL (SSP411 family)
VANSSAWARGQAWALYGYVMAYRETSHPGYLKLAERVAQFILTHPRFPSDKVPYWDFDATKLTDYPEQRDSSAAAIIASALYELSTLTSSGSGYKTSADQILASLSAAPYRSDLEANQGFLLLHGAGNVPAGTEIDVPLIYGDYYFLEANLRKLKIELAD